jgi:hypothetical protein
MMCSSSVVSVLERWACSLKWIRNLYQFAEYIFWDIQDMLIDISHYGCDLENVGSME